MGSVKKYADCGEPQQGYADLWYVKMEGGYSPPYYLLNRVNDKAPYVASKNDLDKLLSGIYFVDEYSAEQAIDAYRKFHGELVYNDQEHGNILESQVMRFK